MPSGRVRWFDAKKGFGFIESDDGHDVVLPQTALPKDTRDVRKGAKVEYSVIEMPWPSSRRDSDSRSSTSSVMRALDASMCAIESSARSIWPGAVRCMR